MLRLYSNTRLQCRVFSPPVLRNRWNSPRGVFQNCTRDSISQIRDRISLIAESVSLHFFYIHPSRRIPPKYTTYKLSIRKFVHTSFVYVYICMYYYRFIFFELSLGRCLRCIFTGVVVVLELLLGAALTSALSRAKVRRRRRRRKEGRD